MSGSGWKKSRIDETKAGLTTVTGAVTARLEELLDGSLVEKELSRGELTALSRELLKLTSPIEPAAKGKP